MATLDYEKAAALLADLFSNAENTQQEGKLPTISKTVVEFGNLLFASATQSYREVLLGCCLARLLDTSIDIRQPYVGQSENAFNGRTLDEKVVNPFFAGSIDSLLKGAISGKFSAQRAICARDSKGPPRQGGL